MSPFLTASHTGPAAPCQSPHSCWSWGRWAWWLTWPPPQPRNPWPGWCAAHCALSRCLVLCEYARGGNQAVKSGRNTWDGDIILGHEVQLLDVVEELDQLSTTRFYQLFQPPRQLLEVVPPPYNPPSWVPSTTLLTDLELNLQSILFLTIFSFYLYL